MTNQPNGLTRPGRVTRELFAKTPDASGFIAAWVEKLTRDFAAERFARMGNESVRQAYDRVRAKYEREARAIREVSVALFGRPATVHALSTLHREAEQRPRFSFLGCV